MLFLLLMRFQILYKFIYILFSIPVITVLKFLPSPLQPVSECWVIIAQFNNLGSSHPLQSPLSLILRVFEFLNFIRKRSRTILFIPPSVLPLIHDVQKKCHGTIKQAECHGCSMSRYETRGIFVPICLRGHDTAAITSGEDESHANGLLV